MSNLTRGILGGVIALTLSGTMGCGGNFWKKLPEIWWPSPPSPTPTPSPQPSPSPEPTPSPTPSPEPSPSPSPSPDPLPSPSPSPTPTEPRQECLIARVGLAVRCLSDDPLSCGITDPQNPVIPPLKDVRIVVDATYRNSKNQPLHEWIVPGCPSYSSPEWGQISHHNPENRLDCGISPLNGHLLRCHVDFPGEWTFTAKAPNGVVGFINVRAQ